MGEHKVELTLSREQFYDLALAAHEADARLSDYVLIALMEHIIKCQGEEIKELKKKFQVGDEVRTKDGITPLWSGVIDRIEPGNELEVRVVRPNGEWNWYSFDELQLLQPARSAKKA
jgi:hypothetical protein